MHAEDREKVIATMAAILLAPKFDGLQLGQKDESELLHEPLVESAVRTARVICDAVEDQEQRRDAVVFEAGAEREQLQKEMEQAARRLTGSDRGTETKKSDEVK